MKAGIKYCGGCNPRYNRGGAVDKIIDQYQEIDFEPVKEGIYYDYVLIINGCRSACAGHLTLNTKNKIFITCPEDLNHLNEKLKCLLSN